MLCVDVESDWGTGGLRGLTEVLPRLLALLERHGARATFFVVGELASVASQWLAPDGPHEVGSHGHTHRRLTRLSADEVGRELVASRAALQAEGHAVTGFRAPFLACPPDLPRRLRAAGYRYDASGGGLLPGWRRDGAVTLVDAGAGDDAPLPRVGGSTLRDGLTPYNLTWMRLLHPLAGPLAPAGARRFSCHLHELLPGDGGWHALPAPLRWLHARGCGERAWRLLELVLARPGRRVVGCGEWLRRAGLLA
jgi:peptidoglycan/xylan/chitin deacetylase (PgdA/CDA1 family)